MELLVVRVVKAFLKGQLEKGLVISVEVVSSVKSQNITEIDVSTADCKNVCLWG